MAISIENPCPPIDDLRIDRFERESGIQLPEDYRKFLLRHNGGHPVACRFIIPSLQEEGLVHYFLALDGPCGNNLDQELAEWQDEMPDGFVPIAGDPGGAIIIMGTVGEFARRVYFWDHQHRLLQSSHEENTYLLAKSFSQFLKSLKPVEDSSEPASRRFTFTQLVEQTLKHADGILPIQLAQLSAGFSQLTRPRWVVAKLVSDLFDHDSLHVRRVAIQSCRRARVFDVPGLREALIEKLNDSDDWVKYDAAWTIHDAGYDGKDVRGALANLAKGTKLPDDERRLKKRPSDAALNARVKARIALDVLLARSKKQRARKKDDNS